MPSPATIDLNPRWLKIKDAVLYSSIGEKRLRRYAKEKKVRAIEDQENKNALIFDRFSLDAYWENQDKTNLAKKRALEIMDKLK